MQPYIKLELDGVSEVQDCIDGISELTRTMDVYLKRLTRALSEMEIKANLPSQDMTADKRKGFSSPL